MISSDVHTSVVYFGHNGLYLGVGGIEAVKDGNGIEPVAKLSGKCQQTHFSERIRSVVAMRFHQIFDVIGERYACISCTNVIPPKPGQDVVAVDGDKRNLRECVVNVVQIEIKVHHGILE